MPLKVALEGVPELKAKIARLTAWPEVKVAVRDTAYAGASVMSAMAPVASGATRAGIGVQRSGDALTIEETATRDGVSYPMILDRNDRYHHKGWWSQNIRKVADILKDEVHKAEAAIERSWNA